MTIAQLVAMHERGAIASHEFVVNSLNLLDPSDPGAVLGCLPLIVLPRLKEFLEEYRPGEMISSHGGPIPTPVQVLAAKRWLDLLEREAASHVSLAEGLPSGAPVGLNALSTEDLLSRGTG